MLPTFVDRPKAAVAFLVLAFAGTGVAVTQLGEEFLPNFQETDFLMHFVEKPGASLESMRRITILASKELRAIPGVRNFGSHIGRAEVADEVVGPNFTELWISVDPDYDLNEVQAKVQAAIDGYPGLKRDVLTYLKERIKEVLSGTSAAIVVRIYGPDLDVLREKGGEIKKAIAEVPGAINVKDDSQMAVPQVQVRLKPDATARFGLTHGQVRRAVATLINGTKVGEIYHDQKSFAVIVRGVPQLRTDLTALQKMQIDLPLGGHVPLGDIADVEFVPTPNEVKRERVSRRFDVSCDVKGRDLGSVANEIAERISKSTLRPAITSSTKVNTKPALNRGSDSLP